MLTFLQRLFGFWAFLLEWDKIRSLTFFRHQRDNFFPQQIICRVSPSATFCYCKLMCMNARRACRLKARQCEGRKRWWMGVDDQSTVNPACCCGVGERRFPKKEPHSWNHTAGNFPSPLKEAEEKHAHTHAHTQQQQPENNLPLRRISCFYGEECLFLGVI